ncbi:MAG: DUF1987 domain-containing protein [Cytophagaceae bacterium]|jgi:hypothetical protein|nr:DUF1987 domain-containing protein [Cytophagaceae bacterium]
MQQLLREGIHNKSPEVNFDANKGFLELKGTSCMENARSFYDELLKWVAEYSSAPSGHTMLHIRLKYFNTSSAKCLLELLERTKEAGKEGKKVQISWYCNKGDSDMVEAAETFSELIEYPIELVTE